MLLSRSRALCGCRSNARYSYANSCLLLASLCTAKLACQSNTTSILSSEQGCLVIHEQLNTGGSNHPNVMNELAGHGPFGPGTLRERSSSGSSSRISEKSLQSPFGPIIWPLKMVIPVTAFFMLLQGISQVIKCIRCLQRGRWE